MLLLAAPNSGVSADSISDSGLRPSRDTAGVREYFRLAAGLTHKDPVQAIEYAEKGIRLSREIDYPQGEALLLKELGIIHMYSGKLDTALYYAIQALSLFEKLKDVKGIAAAYGNIGIVYWYQHNFSKSLDYYNQALQAYTKLNDSDGMANQYNNIGLIYSEQKKYDEAIALYERSLEIYLRSGNLRAVSKRYNNIAIVYEEKGDFDRAMEYYNKAIKLREETGDRNGMVISLNNLGDLLSKNKKYALALEYLDKSLSIAKELGFLDGQKYAYEYLGNTYERLKEYEKALEYHRLSVLVEDSMRNIEMDRQMAEMEARYQNEKKQKEIARLELENKGQEAANYRITLWLILVSACLLGLFLWFNAFRQKKRRQEARLQEEMRKYTVEIEQLRTNIAEIIVNRPSLFKVSLSKDELNRYLLDPLTDRETEILRKIAEGRSNREVAELLFVSENTVKYHLKNIFLKLDVKNRTEALVKASAMNLIQAGA
ncbi:MAG: tetratricopeptide repeat protein [Bacteroidota bacterium]